MLSPSTLAIQNKWDDLYDGADILAAENGGSYSSNVMAMNRAALAELAAEQDEPVEKGSGP